MKQRYVILFLVGLIYAAWRFLYRPLPALLENPLLDLVACHTPQLLPLDGLVVLPLSPRCGHARGSPSPVINSPPQRV